MKLTLEEEKIREDFQKSITWPVYGSYELIEQSYKDADEWFKKRHISDETQGAILNTIRKERYMKLREAKVEDKLQTKEGNVITVTQKNDNMVTVKTKEGVELTLPASQQDELTPVVKITSIRGSIFKKPTVVGCLREFIGKGRSFEETVKYIVEKFPERKENWVKDYIKSYLYQWRKEGEDFGSYMLVNKERSN